MNIHNTFLEQTKVWLACWGLIVGGVALNVTPVGAQSPDVCEGITCDTLPTNICDPGGFSVTQTGFDQDQGAGTAVYTYEICSPPEGVCSGDGTSPCLSNDQCTLGGNPPGGTCDRECAVDTFRGLSHFDVFFPGLGGLESCLSEGNTVGGTCACTPDSTGCSVDSAIVLGDGSCFASDTPVAKCDNTTLAPGDCIEMTLNIAGEQTNLGLGAAVVVSKESGDCNESCLAGPSCEACDDPGTEGEECLTRTLGFWGTHPWITNDYDPVTVCDVPLSCQGLVADPNGKSDPYCEALTCDSVMEGLGSRPAELRGNQPYVAMVKQLTAAKLSLNATAALLEGATCDDFEYEGQPISYWIDTCEGLCGGDRRTITESGCIEALDAFNNSPDVIDGVTPAPFDRPPVDDFGMVSGADPTNFQAAQGHARADRLVIGKDIGGANLCEEPPPPPQ
jgi:hypothetical protein